MCENCKEEYIPPEEIQQDLKEYIDVISTNEKLLTKDTEVVKILNQLKGQEKYKLYRGKGCIKCDNSGYKGRVGIFELLTASEAIAHATLEGSPSSKLHEIAVKEGMLTLMQEGILRALEGTTTLEEVMRVAKQ